MQRVNFLQRIISVLLSLLLSMFGAYGARKYSVDYGGREDAFLNAQTSYRVGARVRLEQYLATDTDYWFTVDGEAIFPDVTDDGKIVFAFTMPEHDVVVDFGQYNTMVYVPAEEETEGELLFDYYAAPTAVIGETIYNEITINRADNGLLFLNVYSGNTDGAAESHHAYRASQDMLDEVLAAAAAYEMAEWADRAGVSMTGGIQVVKFRDDSGSLLRVTTEHMPEDGARAFDEIYSLLCGYLSQAEYIF